MPGTRRDAPETPTSPEKTPDSSLSKRLGTAQQSADHDDTINELIDAGIRIVGDPDLALERFRLEVEQRQIARRREWRGEAEKAPGDELADDSSPPDRSGGAMPAKPSPTVGNRRPFQGFDREREAYAREKAGLLDRYEGAYIVFVGDVMLGPFESHAEAERAGYKEFGLGPLFITEIRAEERAAEVTRLVVP
jgi:hypothetical protein